MDNNNNPHNLHTPLNPHTSPLPPREGRGGYSYIRSYTKQDLALCYFPQSTPHTAVNHLMSWIKRNEALTKALESQGYKKSAKWFSPREVALIYDFLGEP